jgi:hypothetical protein
VAPIHKFKNKSWSYDIVSSIISGATLDDIIQKRLLADDIAACDFAIVVCMLNAAEDQALFRKRAALGSSYRSCADACAATIAQPSFLVDRQNCRGLIHAGTTWSKKRSYSAAPMALRPSTAYSISPDGASALCLASSQQLMLTTRSA